MTAEERIECKKAYVELYEIIRRMPFHEKQKIPNNLIENLKNEMDKNYVFKFDIEQDILHQNLKVETKALLVELYEKYLAKEEEKELWKKYDSICLNVIEQEKKKKYNSDDIFTNRKENNYNTNNINDSNNTNLLIEIKKRKSINEIYTNRKENFSYKLDEILNVFVKLYIKR